MLQPRLGFLPTALLAVLSLVAPGAGLQFPGSPTRPAGALFLEKRQDCPSTYFSCTPRGDEFEGLCCANGWVCSTDADGQPACCPSGAVCTGSVAEPTGAVSFVANDYFSFPYIQTSINAQTCSSYLSQCTSNYEVCTARLEIGGSYGVTVDVPGGGGVTVAGPSITLAPLSAQSVCSSLSSEACFGIQSSVCEQTGAVGAFVIGSSDESSDATERYTSRSMSCVAAAVVALVGTRLMVGQ